MICSRYWCPQSVQSYAIFKEGGRMRVLQRRCYWLLDQDDGIVLVHYLTGSHSRNRHAGGPGGQYKQVTGNCGLQIHQHVPTKPKSCLFRTRLPHHYLWCTRVCQGRSDTALQIGHTVPRALAAYRISVLPYFHLCRHGANSVCACRMLKLRLGMRQPRTMKQIRGR